MRKGYIYLITNKLDGKQYIGQTSRDVYTRWLEHCTTIKGHSKLHNAIQKYGMENFEVKTLEEIPIEELDEREEYWIKELDTVNSGYNICLGGRGVIIPTWKRVGIIENNLVFDSLEDAARIITRLTSWTKRWVREKLLRVIENPKQDFFGYHLVRLDHSVEPSDLDELENWVKTLNIRYQGKHVYSKELDMDFETIGQAAKYLVENDYYRGVSPAPIKQLAGMIGRVINGKAKYVNYTSIPALTFEHVPGQTTKQKGGFIKCEGVKVYCPELDMKFDSEMEAARYMIDKELWQGIKLKTAKLRISDVVNEVCNDYKGYTFVRIS